MIYKSTTIVLKNNTRKGLNSKKNGQGGCRKIRKEASKYLLRIQLNSNDTNGARRSLKGGSRGANVAYNRNQRRLSNK